MRILLSSHFFAPSVGGIEQVSGILAEEFCRLGHEVRVLTTTPAEHEPADQPFTVFRNPPRSTVFAQVRWCDAYLQSNISLATFWPAVLLRKPTLIVYHTWLSRADGSIGWQDRLKRWVSRLAARNLGVSGAVARSVSASCGIVPNPYRDDLFGLRPEVARDRDLVFLGRLVSDKGADLLLDALSLLKKRGLAPNLSIIGTGDEDAKLRLQAESAGLSGQVDFLGKLTGEDLVRALNRHRIMVIPSRWEEPFGLVALEALACGLLPVGSSGGGLADAMGPCGVVFPSGDAATLADRLEELLARPETLASRLASAPNHLARHTRHAVATAYLEHLREIARRSS
jgi:glycosyltransferase involved in cell wall biosynthesis